MNDKHVLKGALEGIEFRPGEYCEFSAALTVDPTNARRQFNKHHISDLAPVSKEDKCCMS